MKWGYYYIIKEVNRNASTRAYFRHSKKKKKIKEINDKFPISNAYQSKKEQTEAYITK